MQEFDVTMKGIFEVPVADHNTGLIEFSFTCMVEAQSPYDALNISQDKLANSFNKGVGYISPIVENVAALPHKD